MEREEEVVRGRVEGEERKGWAELDDIIVVCCVEEAVGAQ